MRAGDRADGIYQMVQTAMLGYRLSSKVTVFSGYTRAISYNAGHHVPVEDRGRQQVTAEIGKLAGGTLSVRLRTEERWRSDGEDTAWRARAQLRWSRPLSTSGHTDIILAHESFVNINSADWGPRGGFERMRNIIGVSRPLIPHVRGELSYINQHGFVRHDEDTSDHALQFALAYSF